MEELRWLATITGISAAVMVSINLGRLVTGWGFVIFTISSVSWMAVGYAIDGNALLTQNAVLTVINLIGIYRWLIAR
jgi:hypothetical protein